MRGGKRGTTTSVNTTPITLRSCAVRGEKSTTAASATTRTPGTLKTNHNASANSTLKQKSLRSRRSSTPQQQESQSQHGGGGEERKFRGPLKKRPITANISSAPSGSTSTTITTRRDASTSKTPTQIVIVKQKLKQAVPTVAASRSRRAIKPNPKYTSEDMVTPRMIKNVASGGTITLSDGSVKRRHPSTSSSEHFFSRESSAEFGAEFQEILQRKSMNDSDKDYNTDTETQPQQNQQQHTNATTNTSELRSSDSPAVGTRKRGRPRRELQPTTDSPTEDKTAASKAQAHDNAVVTKTRSGTPLVQKRKLANEKEISGQDLNVTSKRFVLPSSIAKKFTTNDHNTDDDFENDDDDDDNDDDDDIDDDDDDEDYHIDEPKKRTLHKTTNIGATKPIKKTNTTTSTMKTTKETNLKNEPSEETVDDPPVVEDIVISSNVSNRRKQQFNKRPPTTVPLKSNDVRGSSHTSSIETTTKSTTNNSNNNNSKNINNIRANANKSVQQESSVSALRKETNNNIKQHNNNNNNNNKNNNNTIVTKESNDASGMPCFTIVNINDIISKKGDVMMSKSSADDIVIKSNLASRTKTSDIINGRRDDKVLASVEKKLLTTSRPPQTILNHQLATRNQLTANLKKKTSVEQKPAPRILNAMVAKKTQPVKPVTANPNDSADDSLISLDGDDHDFDGEDGIGGSKNNEFNNTFPSSLNLSSNDGDDFEPDMDDLDFDDDDDIDMRIKELKRKAQKSRDSRSFNNKVLDKKRLVTSTPSTSSSKENKLPTGQHQIQKSADGVTVEIIHQGGKTITKETSVQDWFVAKRNTHPPKRPLPLEKNTLKMPIIDLANMAVDLHLPSKHWNSKVTLYELPASQLAKGSYTTYKGSLSEYNNITEEDRHKFQPSCVMFRRAVHENEKVRLPYDRAVIFKNNTFFINIDGKNVVLASAPSEVETQEDVEILLDIVDFLTLTSMHVELASSI